MTIQRVSLLYILPAFALALTAFGMPNAAQAASSDEVFTTMYGGINMNGALNTSSFTQVDGGNSYACPTGGTLVSADSSGYPSGFFSHPDYYCSVGSWSASFWYYYGHQASTPTVAAPIGSGGGYVCSGGGYFGCAGLGDISIPTGAEIYRTQACSVSNACGTGNGLRNVNGGCDATGPSLPSGYGNSCSASSAPNSCSQTNTNYGTIGCTGACSASKPAAPANPPNYGKTCTVTSAPNSCGMTNTATGTYGCTGACSAATPAKPSDSLCGPTASCTVTPSTGYEGKTSFTYTATGTGGNGSYTYNWTGPEGLTGQGKTVTKTYETAGQQGPVTVTVTSNGIPASASCSPSTVTVNSCDPTLSASPLSIDLGETTDLTWHIPSPTCATSCKFSDGHAVSGATGTYTVTPPAPASGTKDTYGISCPADGSYSTQTDVTVVVPTVSISVAPDRVHAGDASTVTWSSTNIDSCDITRNGSAWKTGLVADANRQVNGAVPDTITTQTIYKITCLNDSGQVSASATGQATVNVIPGFEEF